MKFETVIYEREEDIGVITLNRPERLNTVNAALLRDLLAALEAAGEDREVKAALLKGKGRAFCAGADFKETATFDTLDDYRLYIISGQKIHRATVALRKPLIGAIQGYALGGGTLFALLCDIRIAADNAVFGIPEAAMGATLTSACSQLLARVVGLGKAKELVLTSEHIGAKEAERIGLVNRVVPLEQLDKEAMALTRKIASNYSVAMSFLRTAMDHAYEISSDAYLELEIAQCVANYAYGKRTERMKAFLKKRKS